MNIIDKLKEVSTFLKNTATENFAKEAELIITEALKISKTELYTRSFNIYVKDSELIDSFVVRRCEGEPLQYIIGYIDFYGLKINVGKGVLIPRPETELLVEKAIISVREQKLLPQPTFINGETEGERKILDLCTGSGCIALAMAQHFPHALVCGVDMSDIAIEYAIKNAKENNINNVHFIKGDLFEPISVHFSLFTPHCFDCIISNPPYIKRSEIINLQREIRDYEPIQALDGGKEGLDFYKKIFSEAPKFLKERGLLILEIGVNQSVDIMVLASNAGFRNMRFIKDYSGIERIFIGEAN